ncbi:Wzz/FepE/Etk N-terminal domain-containing protein [Gammaproteobacteria bacterium]|nr:Wzz/FepE/Etk N-terminal domain-containing protein [Gammaproteobacteria bacterium]
MENNITYKNIDIHLSEFFGVLYKKKALIFIITSIFAIISVVHSLNIPNIYTSKAVLAPVAPSDSMSSISPSLTSAASLTGIGISSVTNTIKTQEAITRIKSFDFFNNYFLKNVKLENIMAVEKWDSENNQIIYNSSVFDSDKKVWISSNSTKIKPTSREAYEVYIEKLAISSGSPFINISIRHQSPVIAKKWLDMIIYNINESMREIDKKNAEKAILYLNKSFKNTDIQSLKAVTSNLLESQMKTLMLAESSESYVLKIIDSPFIPEKKSSPNRSLICILGTVLGFITGIFISLILHFREIQNHHKV